MSNSVAEFFSKKGVKKFKNGVKAFADRQAVKVAAVSMVLAAAFAAPAIASVPRDNVKTVTAYAVMEKGDTLCSYRAELNDNVSFARLQKLVNNATKSQTGREILQKISEQETLLRLDTLGQNTVGSYHSTSNSISLNPVYNDGRLQSCLVHEGKHSVQRHALPKDRDIYYDFATNVMRTRVMEADAMATQTKFSYEMMKAGQRSAWDELVKVHNGVATAFEYSAGRYGKDADCTMQETMLAWYQNRAYVTKYDRNIAAFHQQAAESLPSDLMPGEVMPDYFSRTISADTLVKYVCTMGGKPYVTDGSVLTSRETLYLDSGVYETAAAAAKEAAAKTGREDVSADGFHVLKGIGAVSKETYAQVKEKQQAKEAKREAKRAKKGQTAGTTEMKEQDVSPLIVAAARGKGNR